MAGSGSPTWGEGLGYPEWFEKAAPAVHDLFNGFNRYVGVPSLRMGFGTMMSNPLTGYLMLLRTRGRKSGLMREIPLAYYVRGEYVYCMAGFGRETHWFQNILVCPQVEAILPGRAFSGFAEEVTDPAERVEVMPPFARTLAVAVIALGLGNPRRDTDEVLLQKMAGFPLIRIRQTGLAAGPDDPGGLGWIRPIVAMGFAGLVGARIGSRLAGSSRRRSSKAG